MLNFKFTKEFSVIREYHDWKASEARLTLPAMCQVEHKKLKQMAALSKAEQSKARKLSNEHIVSKAKQTSKSKLARKQSRVEHQKLNQVAAQLPPGWVFGFQLDCQCRKQSDPRYAEFFRLFQS